MRYERGDKGRVDLVRDREGTQRALVSNGVDFFGGLNIIISDLFIRDYGK